MGQEFRTVDVVRLEVETDPGGLANLVQNPSGELGGWGWVTPAAGATVKGLRLGDGSPYLRYNNGISPSGHYFHTEALPVAAGHYVAARFWAVTTGGVNYRARFDWLNSSKAQIGQSSWVNLAGAGDGKIVPAALAPASTAFAQLRIEVASSGGAYPSTSAGATFDLKKVTVAKAATSAALGSYRANLVPNPSFETDAGGWYGKSNCSPARSTSQAQSGTASLTVPGTDPALPMEAATLAGRSGIPVSGSTGYTFRAQTRAQSTGVGVTLRAYWFNSSGSQVSSSSVSGGTNSSSAWTPVSFATTSPASAAYVQVALEFAAGGTGSQYVDAVQVELSSTYSAYFDGATADAGGVSYDWATRTPVVSSERTNLVTNPSFETNTAGWTAQSSTLARTTSQAAQGAASGQVTSGSASSNTVYTVVPGIQAGAAYAAQVRLRKQHSSVSDTALAIRWYASADGSGTQIRQDHLFSGSPAIGSWYQLGVTGTAPSNAQSARVEVTFYRSTLGAGTVLGQLDGVMLEPAAAVGAYFDGATADAADSITTVDRAWTGTAHASASTETTTVTLRYSTATSSNLSYVEPVQYLDVLGESHDIKVVREALNTSTLTATVLSAALDPSQGDLVRPGRRCRLSALNVDGWNPVFTGRVSGARVTYDVKDPLVPDEKRARIELTVSDSLSALSNQKRAEGVATIDELPYVLEGCGVPWSVNGSGDQVSSATVVAYNENASAADQVAVTRDSVLGYAWLDRLDVLQAWDPSDPGFGGVERQADDAAYSELSLDYDTQRCINEVNIKFLRHNPSTGQTEEVPYGPWRDEASIATWGVRSAEFTVQGVAEETSALQAYAEAILAANGTPEVQANSVTVPIRGYNDLSPDGFALVDLYDAVRVTNARTGYDRQLRAVRVEHVITPDKWLVTIGFEASGSVASPTFVEPPSAGAGGKTIGQLLVPVGKIEVAYATPAQIAEDWKGWLICDGSTFSASEYPRLEGHLAAMVAAGVHASSTTLPNLTDRFIIGAGTKAVGTTGGDPTKVIGTANLPPHTHNASGLTTNTAGGHTHGPGSYSVNRGSSTGGSGDRAAQGNTTAAGTAGVNGQSGSDGAHSHNVTGSTGDGPGSSTPLDVMNPWFAAYVVIRAV